MIEWWMLTAGANVVMVMLYAAIAGLILHGIAKGHQWRTNPIAVATAAVFVSCTVGHGLHLAHVLPPLSTLEPHEAAAARAMFGDWRLIAWDGVTAVVAVYYWTLRGRFAVIYGGAALCADMAQRQAEALHIHEKVVRGVQRAKDALDGGLRDEGARALDESLSASKDIITHLLGERGQRTALGPGDLRREQLH